jgi:hypothetical protein
MALELGFPSEGEAGTEAHPPLDRDHRARQRLGEESWIQGRMMLGHVPDDDATSTRCAPIENMGKVLAVTESIIDEIEALCPGAFALPDSNVVTLGRKAKVVGPRQSPASKIGTGLPSGPFGGGRTGR